MLYFLVVWSILLPVCLSIGLFILNICHGDEFSRPGDRFIISIWLGIVIFCLSCISCVLVLPLSPGVGGLIALGWVLISASSRKTRQDLHQFYTLFSWKILAQGLAITIAVAGFTTQQIIWFDTGLYHLGSIHWMAEFGAVPGVALINSKFGFTSSWFAFSAPLIFDWSGDNIGAVSNGYLGFITLVCGSIGLHQSIGKESKISDYFIAIFSFLIMSGYIIDNVNGNSLISFSQDIPVALLIGIFAWTILLVAAFPLSQKKNEWDRKIIPLVLAISTVSIKFTALPILGIAVLFYLCNRNFKIDRLLLSVILSLILLLPNAIFAIKTSGCPFYPSKIMCFDLPWTVNKAIIQSEISEIKGANTIAPNKYSIFVLIKKRYNWMIVSKNLQVATSLYIISLSLGILIILKQKQSSQPGYKWIIFLAMLGMTSIMTIIPLLRFAMGYLLIVPSLFIANKCFLLQNRCQQLAFNQAAKLLVKRLVLPLVIGIIVICGGEQLDDRWLLPAKLPQVELIKAQINDLEYTYPMAWGIRCWAAKLPCAALPISYNIRLRNALQGIKSGLEFSQ